MAAMANALKILHTVESYAPSVGGAQEVVKQISELLVARGHDVTVATTANPTRIATEINGVHVAGFDLAGNRVRGITGDVEAYRRFLVEGEFDIVMNYAAQQWATDATFDVLPQLAAAKVLVPCGFSALYRRQYADYFRRMPDWMRQYDATVLMGEQYRDAKFARLHQIENIHLIPNAASAAEFLDGSTGDIRARLGISEDAFLILHVGSHTGIKGHAEAISMFRRARIDNAVLVIVANDFGHGCRGACRAKAALFAWTPFARVSGMTGKRLHILDLSRADTIALYHASDLFLFPSNVECSPIVLFEAAASRTPFLASNAGNSAEIAAWTGAGEIIASTENAIGDCRPSVDDGSRRLEALWADIRRRREMARAGRAAWEQQFTWEKIAHQYEALYFSLIVRS